MFIVTVCEKCMFAVTKNPTYSYMHSYISYIEKGEGYKLADSTRFEGPDGNGLPIPGAPHKFPFPHAAAIAKL